MLLPRLSIASAIITVLGSSVLAGPVTESVFLETHVGNCVNYTGPSTGQQCYDADGTTTYTDETYGADEGTWEFRNGELCVKWSKESATSCNAYVQEDDGSFSAATGYTWNIVR